MIKNTIAPIPLEDLKSYFEDKSITFIIDYNNSTLKGEKLLTYLSNLDVPCDVNFKDVEHREVVEFIVDYMQTRMLVKLPSLELTVLQILLANINENQGALYKNKLLSFNEAKDFIQEYVEIVEKWMVAITSGSIYNLHCINDEGVKKSVEGFEKVDDDQFCGINYVNLYKYHDLYEIFPHVPVNERKFLTKQFEQPMFKGDPMYNYWFVPGNTVALISDAVAEGLWDSNKYKQLKEESLENVSTIW